MCSSATVPEERGRAAAGGELHTVVKWLREGGHVDALYSWGSTAQRKAIRQLSQLAALHVDRVEEGRGALDGAHGRKRLMTERNWA